MQRVLPPALALGFVACGSLVLSQGPTAPPAIAAVVVPPVAAPQSSEADLPSQRELTTVMPSPQPVEEVAPSPEEFSKVFDEAVTEAGSISIGRANRGYLYNGVQMPPGPLWEVVAPEYAWGTRTAVTALARAIKEVNRIHPETPRLHVGHLSKRQGGWLRPHRSHQSGRDVDLGFYYLDGPHWYERATEDNLDVMRTWALLSALAKATPLEYVFVDRRLHPLLRAEAERVGEDEEFVTLMFDGQGPLVEPILRHARGHDDHVHVRFLSKLAVDNALRARARLGKYARNSSALLRLLRNKQHKQEKLAAKAARASR